MLPYQFALEYSKNRASVIVRHIGHCHDAISEVEKLSKNRFTVKRENPHLSIEASAALDVVIKELQTSKSELEKMISNDPYADLILNAFSDCVGASPDKDALEKLHIDADARLKAKIPPGYADEQSKGVPGAYGDYI